MKKNDKRKTIEKEKIERDKKMKGIELVASFMKKQKTGNSISYPNPYADPTPSNAAVFITLLTRFCILIHF